MTGRVKFATSAQPSSIARRTGFKSGTIGTNLVRTGVIGLRSI